MVIADILQSAVEGVSRTTDLEVGLYIFILAGFLGYHIITRVPPLLHTPLMSAANAISGISLIGSLVVAGSLHDPLSTFLGFVAVACSATNVVGGFLITDRMLKMFKSERDQSQLPWWFELNQLTVLILFGVVSLLFIVVLSLTGGLSEMRMSALRYLYI